MSDGSDSKAKEIGAPAPLTRAALAYENPAFLNGSDGRLIRIVSEYLEPLARFRREQIQDTVVFFGSARFRGKVEADHELELLENTGSSQPAHSHEQLAIFFFFMKRPPPRFTQGVTLFPYRRSLLPR